MNENTSEELLSKEENKEEVERFELSRILRFIIVSSFILMNVTFSADVGVIASSKFSLQNDLNFNEKEFAIFNSITSTGRILGTFIYMGLLARDKRKLLICICLLSSCCIFFSFLFTNQKFIIYIIRFLLGLSRNFFQIYVPIYIDQFGVKTLKTLMISFANITSPLGRVFGFTIGTILGENRWRFSFSVLGLILLSLGSFLFLSPTKYFSAGLYFVGYYTKEKNNKYGKLVINKKDKIKYSDSIFEVKEIKINKKNNFQDLFGILKNPCFMFSTFARSSVNCILDISHLFIKDYVQNGLGENNQFLLLKYYSLASLIGPSIGGTLGGAIVTKVGGYEHKNSCKMVSFFSLLALFTIYFLCFTDTLFSFCISLFIFYVTIYMFYPILTGYTVNCLNPRQKGVGYSFNTFICTVCGNFPGPLYYGIINDKFKKTNPRLAWRCSFYYYFVAFAILQFAFFFRYKD